MVDNFEQIEQLLTFEKPGDCYWIQLLRRANDDPSSPGKTNPNYHGNMVSRTAASYFITSVRELMELKDDIVKICNALNCRAYIRLNKRNFEKMTKLMLVNISSKIASNCYCSPTKIAFSVAGVSNSAEERTWVVDIDKEYVSYFKAIEAAIVQSSKNATYEPIVATIKSKNGYHLITKKFNTKNFEECWKEWREQRIQFDDTADCIPVDPPGILKDNPTILYVPGE